MGMKMKIIPKERLIVRNSFEIAFAGGEIWCEQLDSLSVYTDLVKEKFLKDMEKIRRPSCSAFLAVNLHETLVNAELSQVIVRELLGVERRLMKIVFVGLDHGEKKLFRSLLRQSDCSFSYEFIDDFEKAKQWLLNVK